jgi:hypothetical protein
MLITVASRAAKKGFLEKDQQKKKVQRQSRKSIDKGDSQFRSTQAFRKAWQNPKDILGPLQSPENRRKTMRFVFSSRLIARFENV